MATTVRDDALCIRHWDWSETSQTVSLFTREHGLLRGLAKGAKREKAPFSGGVELLTRGEVVAIVRSTGAMATITAWDLTHAYPEVRRSLRSFYAGSYLLDLVHHAVTDADPHPGLFDRLAAQFDILGDRPEQALLHGQWGVLAETGQAPSPPETAGDAPLWFLPREGVFRDGAEGGIDGWRVRPGTVRLLAALDRNADLQTADAITLDRANRLLASYARYLLGRDLPSAEPVFGPNGLAH